MRKHVAYMQISAYAISKMPLYAEKYVICAFWQNMRLHMRLHITGILIFCMQPDPDFILFYPFYMGCGSTLR